MPQQNHYEVLDISPQATQAEIKQAYRRLVKIFHPDSNRYTASHDRIADINIAYEVLSDPQRRRTYDRSFYEPNPTIWADDSGDSFNRRDSPPHRYRDRQHRTADAQTRHRQRRRSGQETDEHLQLWMRRVYRPVNRLLCHIMNPLQEEIDELAADPFDDELLEDFQAYLDECREYLHQAQRSFRSVPNPPNVASVAADLYYCLSQVGDGIDELERFTYSYDEHYLHVGQELFRIAAGLRREAQVAIRSIS
jgi:molecular chaperone DnaJ